MVTIINSMKRIGYYSGNIDNEKNIPVNQRMVSISYIEILKSYEKIKEIFEIKEPAPIKGQALWSLQYKH